LSSSGSHPMRVIVTRVQPQAARWVRSLTPRFEAVAWPLIEVRGLVDQYALQAAGQHWADYVAVMFVSSHAVSFFFESNRAIGLTQAASAALKTRVWATGPGTRAALLAQGFLEQQVDSPPAEGGQFDSEALWPQVGNQITPGACVLIVRGDSRSDDDMQVDAPRAADSQGVGRDWLAQRLAQAGAKVDFAVAYQRSAPVWDAAQCAQATLAATDGSVWLLTSAQALTHLQALMPGQNWHLARVVATHERIAQVARGLGFGTVMVSRPTLFDVSASIESLA
jgi:uroporphyrinogen-III synthase